MVRTAFAIAFSGLTIAGATAAVAQDQPRASALSGVIACRAIGDNAERLACFDKQAATLDEAEKRGDVFVTDRAEVRKAKRTLFGLNVPDLFKGRGSATDEPEITEIDTVLTGASHNGQAWTFILADGTRWRQNDSEVIFEPKAGNKVHIKRGPVGGYFLKVGSQRAVRATRLN